MRYKKLQDVSEGAASTVLISGNRTRIARLMMRVCKSDRLELLSRLYWIGYPTK